MSDPPIEIPNRALFKAAEVCEIARLQPYVLRSWETEFPELGVQKTADGPRVYRRADVDRVLRIKHLLLVDGLTLAGARRRLESEAAAVTPVAPVAAVASVAEVAEDAPPDDLSGPHARERITEVKNGLRSILALLSAERPQLVGEYELTPPVTTGGRPMADRVKAAAAKFGHARKPKPAGKPKSAAKSTKPAKGSKRKHASA